MDEGRGSFVRMDGQTERELELVAPTTRVDGQDGVTRVAYQPG